MSRSSMVCIAHSSLERHEIHKSIEVSGEIAKRPDDQSDELAVQAELMHKG